jgi:hypothetical protein
MLLFYGGECYTVGLYDRNSYPVESYLWKSYVEKLCGKVICGNSILLAGIKQFLVPIRHPFAKDGYSLDTMCIPLRRLEILLLFGVTDRPISEFDQSAERNVIRRCRVQSQLFVEEKCYIGRWCCC